MNEIKLVCHFNNKQVVSERFDSESSVRVNINKSTRHADIERGVDSTNVLKEAMEKIEAIDSPIVKVQIYILDGSGEILVYEDEPVADVFMIDADYQIRKAGSSMTRQSYIESLRFDRDYIHETGNEV